MFGSNRIGSGRSPHIIAEQPDLTTLGTDHVRAAPERFQLMQGQVHGGERPPGERVIDRGGSVPTTEQVLTLVREARSYEEIGERLGVPAGQAYMIATGLPADGGDVPAPEERWREGLLPSSSQHLVNPTSENPTSNDVALGWGKRRAARDEQMRAAAERRGVSPPEIADPGDEKDITVVLTRDHNQVRSLVEQLNALPSFTKGGTAAHQSRRETIVDMIAIRLSRHERAEARYFWPAVRTALDDGEQRADTGLGQEQDGEETLSALGRLGGDNKEFDTLVERLTLQIRKHVAFEERVFLDLVVAMSAEHRERLGRTIRDTQG